ncbi:flagellar motor protein MotB [Denitrobaculum tricleocarpae]|uniref:Motility protein B-like N-terminal domain-containing protein n=1 Tax=Denitrobaculum tricleocarpae TaxID=2591009 RepID=A0A545T206_9PROT|nr:flagellar motor protein MotB [Denitrobaculum tricleocarpae]TQV71267.1 hypothetical protein FKG95_26905 [Denitrobaculum tricleocarpae]
MTQADLNSEETLKVKVQPLRMSRPASTAAARPAASPNAWMVTFTDLVALMLTFFVLLYSMSSLDLVKWQNLTGSLAESLDSVEDSTVVEPKSQLDIVPVKSIPGTDLDYLANVLSERLEEDAVLRGADFVNLGDRLIVSLPDALVFEGQSNELGAAAERTMLALGGLFRSLSNSVEIVSYPIDDLDPGAVGAEREAVWTQTLGRSIRLARLLEDTGYSGSIRPRGVALTPQAFDTQSPEADATGQGARASVQRRFDVVLLDTAGER